MKKFLFVMALAVFSLAATAQDYCSMARKSAPVSGSVSPTFSPLECLYDVNFYFIDVEADDSSAVISARTTIGLTALLPVDTLVFELSSSQIVNSVVVNGIDQNSYYQENEQLKIVLNQQLEPGSNNQVAIRYAGTTSAGGFFTGLSNGYDYVYNKQVTYTLSEPYEAKDWFPVKQDLTDKADSVWVFITTREGLMGGANGLLTNVSHPSPGKVRYEWKSHYVTDFYLISFTVADYIDYSFYAVSDVLGDSLLVQNFIYNSPGILESQKENIDWTGDFIIYFSELFGRYPFIKEKYGHCMAPIGGGMEHQTMTTLQNFNFSLVSHELTHQWFGDYVTCGSWRDIWVNEGFASYGEYLALDKFKGHREALGWMSDAHERAMANPGESVYLTKDEIKSPDRIFDYNLTYKKGASIIHMLRYELNDDSLFFGILRKYLQLHADSTALGSDFMAVVNDMSGKDYSWFFDQWYYGTGYPTIEASWKQYEDSLVMDVYQVQVNNQEKVFKTHVDYQLVFNDSSDTIFRVWLDRVHNHFALPVNKVVSTVVADPDLNVLMSATVYEKSKVTAYFSVIPNPFTGSINILFNNSSPGRKIMIADTKGDLIMSRPAEDASLFLNLGSLEQGLFLLIVVTADGMKYTKKIVKVKAN